MLSPQRFCMKAFSLYIPKKGHSGKKCVTPCLHFGKHLHILVRFDYMCSSTKFTVCFWLTAFNSTGLCHTTITPLRPLHSLDTLFLICVPPSNKQWRLFTMRNRFKPSIQLSWIKHDGIISVWLNFVLFHANLLMKCNSYWVVSTEKAWNPGNVTCIHCWRMRAVRIDQ